MISIFLEIRAFIANLSDLFIALNNLYGNFFSLNFLSKFCLFNSSSLVILKLIIGGFLPEPWQEKKGWTDTDG